MSTPIGGTVSADKQRWLQDFERNWDEKLLGKKLRELPPASNAERRPCLIALVRVDLAQRWATGKHATVEAYLKQIPELAGPDGVPFELIEEECHQRLRAKGTLDGEQMARRYPGHADRVRRFVAKELKKATTLPAAVPVPPRNPGELSGTLGRYHIQKKLGQGGMGAVYLAHDTQLDRQVALKVPLFDPATSPQVLTRFLRESRAAATLTHPNLCPVHDAGEIDGVYYLIMAYIEGRSLSELITANRKMPAKVAASVTRKLALALQVAHDKGIVHRDLKPANVRVTTAGEPVVLDFGLVRRLDSQDEPLTREGAIVGTPAYMSPEQVNGEADVGPASDIYSLGVILFEMLTGEPPFRGPVMSVLAQVMTQPIPKVSSLRKDVSPDLEAICTRATQKRPEDRYPSMKALASDLQRYLKGNATPSAGTQAAGDVETATPDSVSDGTTVLLERLVANLEQKRGKGRSWLLAISGVLVAASLLVLTLLAFFKSDPKETVVINGLTYVNDNSVRFYLDGKEVSREELQGKMRLKVGDHELQVKRDGEVIEVRTFKVQPGDGKEVQEIKTTVVERPDPSDVAVGEIHTFTGLNGGTKHAVFASDTRSFVGCVFSKEDDGLTRSEIRYWRDASSMPTWTYRRDSKTWDGVVHSLLGLALAPDGRRFLTAWQVKHVGGGFNTRYEIGCQDLESKEPLCKPMQGHAAVIRSVQCSPDGKSALSCDMEAVTILWDLEQFKEKDRIVGNAARFTSDGGSIVAADKEHVLWLWVKSGERFRRRDDPFQGSKQQVAALAFSSDNQRVAAASADGTVTIFDVATRKVLQELKNHPKGVNDVSWAPGGSRVLTASDTIRLWDADTGKLIRTFDGHAGRVNSITFSRNGRRALSSSEDNTVRLWQMPP